MVSGELTQLCSRKQFAIADEKGHWKRRGGDHLEKPEHHQLWDVQHSITQGYRVK